MAQNKSDQLRSGGVTQREVLAAAREFTRYLAVPSRIADDPEGYAEAKAQVLLIFGRCEKALIFSAYVTHNLGGNQLTLFRASYAKWERTRTDNESEVSA